MSATLEPRAFLIRQVQIEDVTFFIQRLELTSDGPKWYILLRLNDPAAYVNEIRVGYDTPEAALEAWQSYADRRNKAREDWLAACAKEFVDLGNSAPIHADLIAHIVLEDNLEGDISKKTPAQAAQDEMSKWSQ